MTTFTISFTDAERTQLAEALSLFVKKLTNAQLQVEGLPSAPPAPPAVATVDKPQPRDRWARDRSGNEVPNPKGHYTVSVHLFKAERDDVKNTGAARMKVAFDSPTGKGTVEAACFDEKLFPFLAVAKTQPTATLHVVKNGKYLNVIGVRP